MKRIARIIAMVVLAGSYARADSIKPWSGASTSARVFEPRFSTTDPITGPVASASSSKSVIVRYEGTNYPGESPPVFSTVVTGSARAEATGHAGGLLVVGADYSAVIQGNLRRIVDGPDTSVGAAAGWSGDRLTIHPASGSPSPGTVRLNFRMDLGSRWLQDYDPGKITVSASDHSATFTYGMLYDALLGPATGGPLDRFFDKITADYSKDGTYATAFHGTFHLDLPVNAAGISDPFSLGLSVAPDSGLRSNQAVQSRLDDEILSLTSITTADGTLLSDLGDAVSFDSGMLAPGARPSPVPEPSSLAAVGLLVVAGLFARRRLLV